jgi:4-hydroxybenzoate polyprenyltransferase
MVIAFLRLIRLPNLLIIALTMYMVRFGLVGPLAEAKGMSLQMPELYFFLLVLAVVMVAAAGYIINDYFDVRIDKVNKPELVVVDNGIKRRVAMGAHTVISFLGILIGSFVSYKAHFFKLGSILFVFSATSLWFYSTTFKRQFLIGNIVIALLSGMVPFIAGLYEMNYINNRYHDIIPVTAPQINSDVFTLVAGFSFFAFILTLLREIIKDTEDREGDEEFGCRTLPVVLGLKGARIAAVLVSVFVLFLISYLNLSFYQDPRSRIPFFYIALTLQLPLVLLTVLVVRAREKKDFRRISMLNKIIMLSGICFWVVLRLCAANGNWFGT